MQALETKIDGLEEVPKPPAEASPIESGKSRNRSTVSKENLVRRTPNLGYRSSAKLLEKIRQLRSGTGNFPGIEGPSAAPTDAQAEWLGRFDTQLNEVEQHLERLVSVTDRRVNPEKLGEAGVAFITTP